ncbi:MAG: transporter substrate-binding domain-containing protein [Desulfobacterales bacterium]|nr:transporter substrate-binding domain-containing protein [Desulfobacterales bacterium]
MKNLIKFVFCTSLLFGTTVMGTELKFATQEFAPFSYETDGVVSGPVADIIRAICKEMETDCSFKSLPWARSQLYVKKGKMQGLFVIAYSDERSQWLTYSPPVLNTEYGFFVQNDNPLDLKQLSDISSYKIGVYGPSNTSKSLEKLKGELGNIVIDMTPHDEFPFKKLILGRVDAVYSNRDVGFALLRQLGLNNVKYIGAHKKLQYYIAFSKKYTDMKIVEKFNTTFMNLYKQGKIQQILAEYKMKAVEME